MPATGRMRYATSYSVTSRKPSAGFRFRFSGNGV